MHSTHEMMLQSFASTVSSFYLRFPSSSAPAHHTQRTLLITALLYFRPTFSALPRISAALVFCLFVLFSFFFFSLSSSLLWVCRLVLKLRSFRILHQHHVLESSQTHSPETLLCSTRCSWLTDGGLYTHERCGVPDLSCCC